MKIHVTFENGQTVDFTRFRGRLTHRNIKRQYTQEVADRVFKLPSDSPVLFHLIWGVRANQRERKYRKEVRHLQILRGINQYYINMNHILLNNQNKILQRKD